MPINFDNMRLHMAELFNEMVDSLNTQEYDVLQEELAEFRSYMGALLSLYDPDQKDFSDMSHVDLKDLK